MSKKLLEESTIRSFMKLANLQPLSEKFISEKYMDEKSLEEEVQEEGESLEESDLEEELQEEVVEEEGEVTAEGKESEGRPSSPRQSPKGSSLTDKKPGKMDAAKNARGDDKLKPAKKTSHHSDKSDSIEFKQHSNAPKKNNSQFEVVTEALEEEMKEEEMDAPDMGGEAEMGSAGETGDHQEKMKELIRDMLAKLAEMGGQYGLDVAIEDGEGGGEEAPAPEAEAPAEEDETVMQEKLDEMVEKLTKRVAARLVKESKKKR